MTRRDRVSDLGAGRVLHRHQPDERQPGLEPFALGGQLARRQPSASRRDHPDPALAEPCHLVLDCPTGVLVQRGLRAVGVEHPVAASEHRLRRALGVQPQTVVFAIGGGHQLQVRVEVK